MEYCFGMDVRVPKSSQILYIILLISVAASLVLLYQNTIVARNFYIENDVGEESEL